MEILKRGLSKDLGTALSAAYKHGGWWRSIVDDPEVFVAPRRQSVCAYYRGNCLLKLEFSDGRLKGKVHYKYLLKPDLKPSSWEVVDGSVQRPAGVDPFVRDFLNLGLVKRASKRYAGEEKHGVSEIIAANPNVIDIEVAFGAYDYSTEEDDEAASEADTRKNSSHRRMDFVVIQDGGEALRVVFFEAKHFGNQELRSRARPRVAKQIEEYRRLLESHKEAIKVAYRQHCSDMLQWDCVPTRSARRRFLEKVIDSSELEIDTQPHLVVFGFDAEQKAGAQAVAKKLEGLFNDRVILKGSADGLVRGVGFQENSSKRSVALG